jgi:hypothetical protein
MKYKVVLAVWMLSCFHAFSQEIPEMPKVIPDNWLTYHLAHPGPGVAYPGDPNCAFILKAGSSAGK